MRNTAKTQLPVWSLDSCALVKISGRANFSISCEFKTLVLRLQSQGCRRLVLDLTDCMLMDSTFLGILAGLGRTLDEEGPQPQSTTIELLNASSRITDLLDNLGVIPLFHMVQGEAPQWPAWVDNQAASLPQPASHAEISKTCLEAHQNLMKINPNNVPKFQDVTRFLAEEVEKAKKDSAS